MMTRHSVFRDQLHIFGFAGLAVAYPIYSFLLANPAYLIANGVTSQNLYLIIALSSFVLPAVLIVFGVLLNYVHKSAYRVIHLALIWVLLVLAFLPMLSRMDFLSVWLVFGLSAVAAALVTKEYRSNLFTYTGLLLLAPLGLAFPVNFALDESIGQILRPKTTENFKWQASGGGQLPPVILIVFDELPLIHILNARGEIDQKRFPNFAALGREATWYSNASTVHDQTIKAVPAILSGLYPLTGRILPVPENYPRSLFAILREQYTIHALESLTALAGTGVEDFRHEPVELRTVVPDIAIFYLRSLLPAKAADDWLPLEDGIWGGFLSQAGLREWLNNNADWRKGDRELNKRFEVSEKFVREIDAFPRDTFHYFHVAIPHRPYGYLPSGRQYDYAIREDKQSAQDMSQGEINQGRAAHILQVGLADKILGMFKEKLFELGYWDEALVIVVADHGQAYQEEKNNRIVTPQNFGAVAMVPLLIKYPGQKSGSVDDANVQTIDIAPTIVDILNIRNAPRMDGRSLVEEDADIPKMKMILSESGKHYEISRNSYHAARENAHQDAIAFFTLEDPRSDLFHYGAGLDYIGENLNSLDSYKIPALLEIHDLGKFLKVNTNAENIPLFVQGEVVQHLNLDPKDVVITISNNGIVRAVTTPYFDSDGRLLFNKILPEDALVENNDLVATLLVADSLAVEAVPNAPP
jgi:hypothetical protein